MLAQTTAAPAPSAGTEVVDAFLTTVPRRGRLDLPVGATPGRCLLDPELVALSVRRNRSARPGVRESMMTDVDEPTRLRHTEFEVFYRTQWEEVHRPLAVVLRNPDLAREATDEAMTRALRHWRTVKAADNQAGWVYRVAHNWAVDQIRRRRRKVRLVDAPPVWQPIVPDPAVFEAVSRLPYDQRAVVVLRLVEDWSERDVAQALGIAPGTVKSRLSRALARLREELS